MYELFIYNKNHTPYKSLQCIQISNNYFILKIILLSGIINIKYNKYNKIIEVIIEGTHTVIATIIISKRGCI